MSKQLVEVFYGRHRVYHVIAERGPFTVSYCVRSTDGKVLASFKRLDAAVQWAQNKAAQA